MLIDNTFAERTKDDGSYVGMNYYIKALEDKPLKAPMIDFGVSKVTELIFRCPKPSTERLKNQKCINKNTIAS